MKTQYYAISLISFILIASFQNCSNTLSGNAPQKYDSESTFTPTPIGGGPNTGGNTGGNTGNNPGENPGGNTGGNNNPPPPAVASTTLNVNAFGIPASDPTKKALMNLCGTRTNPTALNLSNPAQQGWQSITSVNGWFYWTQAYLPLGCIETYPNGTPDTGKCVSPSEFVPVGQDWQSSMTVPVNVYGANPYYTGAPGMFSNMSPYLPSGITVVVRLLNTGGDSDMSNDVMSGVCVFKLL